MEVNKVSLNESDREFMEWFRKWAPQNPDRAYELVQFLEKAFKRIGEVSIRVEALEKKYLAEGRGLE